MGGVVYLLCAATALACGLLLLRGYFRHRTRFLLWCAAFFLILTLENLTLFIDREIVPTSADLLPVRRSVGLLGIFVLIYGLVWEGMPFAGRSGGAGWPK